jgi:uncharacterized SAM-binding protein YcdF (DUF218 family)
MMPRKAPPGLRHNRAPTSPRSRGSVNSLFVLLGIESWKPALGALLLPPVPFLLLVLVGARLILPRRGWGWALVLLGVAGVWLSACTGAGRAMEQLLLRVPPALTLGRIAQLKAESAAGSTAIVVLGGGVEDFAPEYGVSSLSFASLERLRYGLWLGGKSGLPVAFSGGVGWADRQSAPEAEVAAGIAAQEFGHPLRWTEAQSRDTQENARNTVALLERAGVTRIVLVTHGWHMPRAKRAFDDAAAASGVRIDAAPMGLARGSEAAGLDWLPSTGGFMRVRRVLHEVVGGAAGA